MSFLRIMDVVEHDGGDSRQLILWIDPVMGLVATVDLSQKASLPVISELKDLEESIGETAKLGNRMEPAYCHGQVSDLAKKIRDRAWETIKLIVSAEPDCYDRLKRARMISDAQEIHKVSRPKIVKDLKRYWHGGATPNALFPQYYNCGAPGIKREPGKEKRGRPRRSRKGPLGVNIDSAMVKLFTVAVQRFGKNAKRQLKSVYDKLVEDFFTDPGVDKLDRKKRIPKPEFAENGYPTFEQFLYHVKANVDMLKVHEDRIGRKAYARNERGLPSTSAAKTWGPGARFQIDATIADVYLVSRLDRTIIIGRPVLYIVIDVFSRMIVGIYIGLEGPSWVGAMMALANTVEDKVSFCARYGVTIEPSEWPCHHLPAAILGDRGEMEGRNVDSLENRFNVRIEIAASQRADWKGIVERRFGLLPAKLQHEVPGWVHEDHLERCGKDYRLDATLNIDEFTALIIELVVLFNNNIEIGGYDREPGMTASGVPSIPIDLFEWGIANRSGRLRSFDPAAVRFALMPTDTAKVTKYGLLFKKLYYHNAFMLSEQWLAHARQKGTWPVTISYDPRDLDVVYLHTEKAPGGFFPCDLTERSRDARGGGLWEIEERQDAYGEVKADGQTERQTALATTTSRIDDIVDKAISERPKASGSRADRIKGIKNNRESEKQTNRRSESDSFRPHGPKPEKSEGAKTLPFNPKKDDCAEDFSSATVDDLQRLRMDRDNV